MSLKSKLLASFGSVACILAVVGAVSYFTLSRVTTSYDHVVNSNFANFRQLANIRAAQKDMIIALESIVERQTDREQNKEAHEKFDVAGKAIDEASANYEKVPFVEGEEALWKDVTEAFAKFRKDALRVIELSEVGTKEAHERRDRLWGTETQEIRLDLRKKLATLMDFHKEQAAHWQERAESAVKVGNVTVIACVIVGFLTAMFLGFMLSRSLSNTLRDIANRISSGSDEVASASRQISSASESLSSSATEQAASLEETAASIEEMSAMIGKNADNAKKSRTISDESQGAVARGKESVNEVISAIDQISQSNTEIMKQIETSNNEISEIVKVIAEIGNKTKVINDIVFQTKLLSFNASVEAARAGEHGKGFAVVAEEVGNLAQMSGNAAKEISSMLDGSIQKVEGIVNDTKSKVERLVETGRGKVEAGTQVARRCGEVLEEIVRSVTQVSQAVGEISTASEEQSRGVQEITKAMSQLDHVTQQNASSSEEAASAAEELSAQAETLRAMVGELVVTIEGGTVGESAQLASNGPSVSQERKSDGKVVPIKTASRKKAAAPSAVSTAAAQASSDEVPRSDDPRFGTV